MRDNGNDYGSSGSGRITSHIKPVHWSRTEHQLKPHESFVPEYIETREPMSLSTGDGYTMRLATPPAWRQDEDMPCLKSVPRNHGEDPFDTSDEKRAKVLCAGCPVKQVCLDEAMDEEQGLGPRSRWLVRGGLTPKERADLKGSRD